MRILTERKRAAAWWIWWRLWWVEEAIPRRQITTVLKSLQHRAKLLSVSVITDSETGILITAAVWWICSTAPIWKIWAWTISWIWILAIWWAAAVRNCLLTSLQSVEVTSLTISLDWMPQQHGTLKKIWVITVPSGPGRLKPHLVKKIRRKPVM